MRQVPAKIGWIRALAGAAMLGALLVGLAACWLFNLPPNARFTVSVSEGRAPLLVEFSAASSDDEDGDIVEFQWSFGDGTSAQGMDVEHTFQNQGTFTVLLRVTDNYDASDEARVVITVLAPEPPGPSASFSTSTTAGTAPLRVTFNASASSYDSGYIDRYEWDFGDGGTGVGRTTSHTYFDEGTFTVRLTVRANDGKTGTATATISVAPIGGGGTPPAAGAPSAKFVIGNAGSVGAAPFQALFDPSTSEADDGRLIVQYVWSFGDGDAATDINPTIQEHVYVTDKPSETFSVTLIVLDNEGAQDTITKTVKVYNHQPVAGFEIADPAGGETAGFDGDEHYPNAAAVPAGRWVADDVIQGDIQSIPGVWPKNVNVFIRSVRPTPLIVAGFDAGWFDLDGTAAQTDLEMAEGVAYSSNSPATPDNYVSADHNLSYDPEGQKWAVAAPPWFPVGNQAWGIKWIYVDWDDGTGEEQFDYNVITTGYTTDAFMGHVYVYPDTAAQPYDITIRVVDFLGGETIFSRRLTLSKAME